MTQYICNLAPISIETAQNQQKQVLDKALKQVGFIPNMYKNMANLPALLDTYLEGYAAFREQSEFSPAEQEVVFLTISRDNACQYCVAAHSVLADTMSGVDTDVTDATDAIRENTDIPDQKLATLHDFTHHVLSTQGRPSQEAVTIFLESGYSEKHILAIILAISVKTLSNYSNHIFNTEVDAMFDGRTWHK